MACSDNRFANPLNASFTLASGYTQYFHTFTVGLGQALVDVSHFGGSNYIQMINAIRHLGGTATGFLGNNVNNNPFAADNFSCGQLTLTFDNGCTATFAAWIGTQEISVNYESGAESITVNWANGDDSEPVVTWTTS
jgi:hypothetical protein